MNSRPDAMGDAAEESRSLASGLAEMGKADEAVGFVESIWHRQAHLVDGKVVSQVANQDGGLSRTVRSTGPWGIASVPWSAVAHEARAGLSACQVGAVNDAFTRRNEELDERFKTAVLAVESAEAAQSSSDWTTEVIADIVTRRRSVARRQHDAQSETTQWSRVRMRTLDLSTGIEIDRRQWVARGETLRAGELSEFVGQPITGPQLSGRLRNGRHHTAVVLEGAASACLIHELLGHAAEQDSLSLRSPFAAAVSVLSDLHPELTVRDDPSSGFGVGDHFVDDDGVLTMSRPIMEDGHFVSGLGTLAHPSSSGGAGCARRSRYSVPSLPRASNTVMDAGSTDEDVLLSDGPVLVIPGFASGYVIPQTGEFQFVATRCHLRGGPAGDDFVGDVVITGSAVDVIRAISAVGRAVSSTTVTCGKKGQKILVGMSSPSIRIDRLEWTCG